ncbi:MAG: putative quinol monooxygenase [Verrucomicrobiota bacterium]|mgnify:CR=1 FL=1
MSADSHPVAVTALFQARAGREEELRSLLKTLVAPTRHEAGCIRYDLHENPDATGAFIFLEAWRSEPDLERHLASVYVQAFRARVPDLIAAPPVITLWRQIA